MEMDSSKKGKKERKTQREEGLLILLILKRAFVKILWISNITCTNAVV